jgi:hypothetical protein
MTNLQQNILNAVILIAVAALLVCLMPKTNYTAHGFFLSNGQTFAPANPSDVKVYTTFPNKQYVSMGLVRTTIHFGDIASSTVISKERQNMMRAKQLVATDGANGLIITSLGRTQSDGPLDGAILYAQAIRVAS